MAFIEQTANGFVVQGPPGFDGDCALIGAHRLSRLIRLALDDHPCETPGGDSLPCPIARVTLELLPAEAA